MSLNRFMHERNRYREKPDFKQLAILYPEFRKIAITDIAGKVKINFKDEESLRVLTKTLLKHDFDLEVDIPPQKLVPALPLRLNYILWVEDLLRHSGVTDMTSVHGIDIGTGAICIYPLLFCKNFKSKMTCTDIDPTSVNSAKKIIENNNLQDLIKVILVKKESILKELMQENEEYSFVMCNPPFFETDRELGKKTKQEPPRNAPTGNESELAVQGGEREFILRLIDESLEYKNKIKIYTTMFGQKSSLSFLRNELTTKGILNFTWTEFCQGHTKRWGIAWTFLSKDDVDLTLAPVIRTRTEILKLKKNKSMEIIFPARENLNCLDEIVSALKKWITELKIKMKEIQLTEPDEEYNCWACQLIGYTDTWSHARRKRRLAMRQEASKKPHLDSFNESAGEVHNSQSSEKLQSDNLTDQTESTEIEDNATQNSDPLLVCTLLVGEKSKDCSDEDSSEEEEESDKKVLRICMIFESGYGGKLSLETLRQYLINKLNIREYVQKQKPNTPKKKKKKRKKSKKIKKD